MKQKDRTKTEVEMTKLRKKISRERLGRLIELWCIRVFPEVTR